MLFRSRQNDDSNAEPVTQGLPSRRSFVAGAAIGTLGGVAGVTGFQKVAHAETGDDADHAEMDTDEAHGVDRDEMDMAADLAVDIGFCTDMTVHHMQAVGMCERVLSTDTGGPVQSAATEVLRNQSIEIGMMRAWLADWNASTVPPETVMGWMNMDSMEMESMDMDAMDMDSMDMDSMDMDSMDLGTMDSDSGPHQSGGIPLADMPGYATDAELSALSLAKGKAKGRMWLELMREHHVGGVAMASAAREMATSAKVVRLARTQATVQSYEIEQYDQLLRTIYA